MPETPPPAKPLLRPRNVVLLSFALLAAWAGVEVFRALTARPGSAVDYGQEAIDLVERYQPAGPGTPNGWDMLIEAIRREDAVGAAYRQVVLPEEGDQAAFIDYTLLYSPDAPAAPYEPHGPDLVRRKTAQALEDVRATGAFDKLAEMASTPRAVRPRQSGRLIEWLLPELGKCRNFARMGAARMHMATVEGNAEELVEAYEQTLALGRVCAMQHTLIDHLVGVAIVALANSRLRLSLMDRQWDAATLRGLLDATDRQLPLAPLSLPLSGERLATLDTIQTTYTDDGRGDGRMIVSEFRALSGMWSTTPELLGYELPDTKLVNLAGVLFAGKAATIEKAEEYYKQAIGYSQTPAWQRASAPFHPDIFSQELSYRYALLKLVTPALGKANHARTHVEMDIAGTRLMLAVELFRAEHGRYPAALGELVPSVLAEMPLDPYCGREFGFAPRDPAEDPEDPRPYVLYSTGADATDNGGIPSSGEPMQALRPAGQGTDFVVNQPRPKPEPQEE